MHVIDEADCPSVEVKGLSREEFPSDETRKRTLVRSAAIIGEAVGQVPNESRERHPEIGWRATAGMRDKVVQLAP